VNRAGGPASPVPDVGSATGDVLGRVETTAMVALGAQVGSDVAASIDVRVDAVAARASDPTRGELLPPPRRASRPDARRRRRPAIPMAIVT
jgi:hypothetical protein